jgi:cob(I)alamin adenosyltransferase
LEDERPFDEPRLALNRIYTRLGDVGETSLAGGQRTAKDALRVEAYGAVDELSAFLGCARVTLEQSGARLDALGRIAERVQHELFNLGSMLATPPGCVQPRQPQVTDAEVRQLEREIDRMNESLPALTSFVLPGGSRLASELHVCRTVCRRAERRVVALGRREEVPEEAVRYLNRLSDAMFVWSRWANLVLGSAEVLWQPNRAASGG